MKNLREFLANFLVRLKSKAVLLSLIILTSTIITLGFFWLLKSIYHDDKPQSIPPKAREEIRGAIKENIAEPIATVAPSVGRPLITAAFNGLTLSNQSLSLDVVTTDPTANWQTYRDEKLGFEVKYPEGYRLYQAESGLISFANDSDIDGLNHDKEHYANSGFPYWGGKLFQLRTVSTEETVRDYAISQFGLTGVDLTDIKLGQMPFLFVKDSGPNRYGGGTGYYYITKIGNLIYEFDLDYFLNQEIKTEMASDLKNMAGSLLVK